MKKLLCKITRMVIYFLTPEDSGYLVHHGSLSFSIDADTLSLGSIKAVFWLVMALMLPYLFSNL